MGVQGQLRKNAPLVTRERVSLDGVWSFRYADQPWRAIDVPAPWQAEVPDLAHSSGHAIYARPFTLPDGWDGREIALHFGAVNYLAEVKLNGHVLGQHEGGYLPFSFVLPAELLRAENRLEVAVTLPDEDRDTYPDTPFSEIPHGKQSWYGPLGGIWQTVYLEARDARHVTRTAINADPKTGLVEARVLPSVAAAHADFALRVVDADGRECASASGKLSGETRVELAVEAAAAWSPDAPNLYSLEIDLLADGKIVDHRSESFGFRSIETRDGRILLNGTPIYLRAALDQDYYPDGICTPPSLEFLEDQARKAKALGLNMLRCHIKVPDPRYYDVADRFGLLVWSEIPNVATFSDKAGARLRETMTGILERDGNHPSIVIWTLINEDWGTRLVENAEHRSWLKSTYDWLKTEDPTRLVVDNSACFPNFHVKSDLNDYHYYRSVPERREEWDTITAEFAAGADWTYSGLGDEERRGDEPLICSEFGVWGLPDPSKLLDARSQEPFWFESGATWGNGAGYPHGILDRYKALKLDSVFGTFDRFIEAAQWYQFSNLKYEIEVLRRHESISGYVITELTDVHWESNGLMDLNRNPRAFGDVFSHVNSDIVIVPRVGRYSAWSGDQFEIGLGIATGSARIPAGATLTWSGDLSGSCKVPETEPLAHLDLGSISGNLPQTDTNRMARIEFVLEVDGVEQARNHIEIALFARQTSRTMPSIAATDDALADYAKALGYPIADGTTADLILARSLTATDIEALQGGARYLVLADAEAPATSSLRADIPAGEMPVREMVIDSAGQRMPLGDAQSLPGIGLVARDSTMWRGDWIASFSWIARTGAFADLPGGPLLDLPYSDVVPHHVLTGFRDWEFGSRVKAGLVVGWIHQPAATIADRKVGNGWLTATTFRLTQAAPEEDPVATYLFNALISNALSVGR